MLRFLRRRQAHRIQFFTKDGCPLCQGVRATLGELRHEYDLSIQEFDITTDSALFERYKYVIPVVIVDDSAKLEGRIRESDLRQALASRGPSMPTAGFEVVVEGLFDRARVIVHWSNEPRQTTPEIEREIERAWTARLAAAQRLARKGALTSHLYNGHLCRFIGARIEGATLHLELGATDFRALVGTNLSHPEWLRSLGAGYLANALGVHAAVISRDERIVVLKRSGLVTEAPGEFDVCGGHIERDLDVVDGRPDPFAAITRELQEEMAIAPADLADLVCLGLARNTRTFKPDLIFAARATRSARQLLHGPLDDEHVAARTIGADKRSIEHFLARYGNRTAPAGVAALRAVADFVASRSA